MASVWNILSASWTFLAQEPMHTPMHWSITKHCKLSFKHVLLFTTESQWIVYHSVDGPPYSAVLQMKDPLLSSHLTPEFTPCLCGFGY